MFGVIKRVISGEEVNIDGNSRDFSHDDNNYNNDGALSNTRSDYPTSSDDFLPAALIENDNYMHTPRSSLSDMSAARRELENIDHATGTSATSTPNNNYNNDNNMMSRERMAPIMFVRKDSRASSDASSEASMKAASSQNSSRDWGWFEDVHAGENQSQPNKRKDNSFKKSSNKKEKTKTANPADDGFVAILHMQSSNLVHGRSFSFSVRSFVRFPMSDALSVCIDDVAL